MATGTEPALKTHRSDLMGLGFPIILAIFVVLTRVLCRGPVYFSDGPNHILSITSKLYIIQPPGYWLFNRVAGLFGNPALAISTMNISFSAAGVVVFYFTACLFTQRRNAFLAALAYSTIFYIWFSSEIHSTYASQILFPVASFYLLLCYERNHSQYLLWLAAFAFAAGAGFRPTDGLFVLPLVLYFAAFRMPRKEAGIFLALIVVLCLGWIIPTWLAYQSSNLNLDHNGRGMQGFAGYVHETVTLQSIFTGVRMYTVANFVRYLLPLLVGLWPVLGFAIRNAVLNRNDWRVKALLIWIIPASAFFLLVLISNAAYLDCITAAFLLLAVSEPKLMLVTALSNSAVFLLLGPIPSQKLSVNILNGFVLRYTHKGVEERYNPTLSEMQQWKTRE